MSSEIIVASWQHVFRLSNRIHLAPLYFWSTSVTFAVKSFLWSWCRHTYFWLVNFWRFYIRNAYDSAFGGTSSSPSRYPFLSSVRVFLGFFDLTRKVFEKLPMATLSVVSDSSLMQSCYRGVSCSIMTVKLWWQVHFANTESLVAKVTRRFCERNKIFCVQNISL
jgi:hypothetical protein